MFLMYLHGFFTRSQVLTQMVQCVVTVGVGVDRAGGGYGGWEI